MVTEDQKDKVAHVDRMALPDEAAMPDPTIDRVYYPDMVHISVPIARVLARLMLMRVKE